LAVFVGIIGATVQLTGSASSAPIKAQMADNAADMVGVNTHISFKGTVYDTGFETIIKPRLLELGVRHIRDSPGPAGDSVVKSRFIELARSGIRTLMINWPERNQGLDYVRELNQTAGFTVVEAVEPPNERDITWQYYDFGPEWPARMSEYMSVMYPAYKGNSATANITVLGPSFANTRDSALRLAGVFPEATTRMNVGNLHNYSGLNPEDSQAGGWGLSLPDSLQRYRALAGSKPLWVTENGYKQSGSVAGHPAVTSRAAAKYFPRQFLMHLKHDVRRFYIYELINEVWEDFGLLDNNGAPRQQYWSVKRFIGLLKDPGPSFNTSSIDYQLIGDLTNIYTALFQKRNGKFYLVVWQGVASVKGAQDAALEDIEPPARRLTLGLASRMTQARIYQPLVSMRPQTSYSNPQGITSIVLSVPDNILVVELMP
jgi:hypothetical protein